MKAIVLGLLIAILAAVQMRGEEQSSEPELFGGPIMEVQFILYRTEFPITFRELYKKLGGEQKLKWCCESGRSRAGVSRHFGTFQIVGAEPPVGTDYQVEFEYKDVTEDRGNDVVIRARVCIVTPHGTFYADDLRETVGDPPEGKKSEANKRVEATSGTRPEI